MKVAAIQMRSGTRTEDNLHAARALLEQAAAGGAELAVLPEYFSLMARSDRSKPVAQEPPDGSGPAQQWMAQTARELGIWLAGCLPLSGTPPQPQRAHNALLAYNPQGQPVARYDKMHLFRFSHGTFRYDETATTLPGSRPALFELPSRDGHTWRVGLSICYDLRFPELYRSLSAQGADLLLVPSAFTHVTGSAHWKTLLTARAVENLCALVAPGQGGEHENGRRTWGHSMVIDPWGQVLAELGEEPGIALAELDAAQLADCRQRLPALTHRVLI